MPRFTHELLDQTALAPKAVAGNVKARIAQLLMMAAAERHVDEALRSVAPLLVLLYGREGGRDEARPFFVYLATTQEPEVIKEFGTTLQRHGLEKGDEIMATYAQELLAQGRTEGLMEGEQRAKVETVEGFLRVGVAWDVIEAATGLTEASFQAPCVPPFRGEGRAVVRGRAAASGKPTVTCRSASIHADSRLT